MNVVSALVSCDATGISDEWLCHTDARQVSDLPSKASLNQAVYDRLQTILSISTLKGSSSFGHFSQKRRLDQR